MAIIFRDNRFDDRSGFGCSSRVVFCEGEATASDPVRAVAAREARDEAREQLNMAIANSEAAVDCPMAGCSLPDQCRRIGDWRVGRTAGSAAVSMEKDAAGNWIVRRRAFVERVLRCACVNPGAIADKRCYPGQEIPVDPKEDRIPLDEVLCC